MERADSVTTKPETEPLHTILSEIAPIVNQVIQVQRGDHCGNLLHRLFADKIRERWDHHRETRQAQRGLEKLLLEEYPEAGREDKYILTFRQRALLYPLEQKYILKPLLSTYSKEEIMKLPESFSFTNCSYHEEFARIYREFEF